MFVQTSVQEPALSSACQAGLVNNLNDGLAWGLAPVLFAGAGTAMVYPTLLAAIGGVAHPAWRARSVGIYRLWRDGGFAVGALLAGVLADLYSIHPAAWVVAGLIAAIGVLAALRMYETHRQPARKPSDADSAGGPAADERR